MNEEIILNAKKGIMAIGVLLWEKELVTGLNGNISVRLDEEHILLTATKTCLGLLQPKDILLMNLQSGEVLEEGEVSSEKLMHTEIYKALPDIKAILHTHTPFANAYFLENEVLHPRIFETKLYLGEVRCVDQKTPSVTDPQPIVEALGANRLVVLRNHGVLAVGKDLFENFLLIQCLEDAVKVDAISRLYRGDLMRDKTKRKGAGEKKVKARETGKTYKLFSPEQIAEIVRLVNEDEQMKELGAKSKMTMDLAVRMEETGTVYSFSFEDGHIARVGQDPDVEFLISAPEAVWRAVFARQVDPFVATTQKRMSLRGDFARISKWYAPCSRIFELWTRVPVA